MTLAIRASTSPTNTASVTIPAATQVGDLILIYASAYYYQPSLPAGFTQIQSVTGMGSYAHYGLVGYKIAVSGDAGSSVTFGNMTYPYYTGGSSCVVVSGAAASPIRTSAGLGQGNTAINTNPFTPAATDLVLAFFGQMGNSGTVPNLSVPGSTSTVYAASGSSGYGGCRVVSGTGFSSSINLQSNSDQYGGNTGIGVAIISGTREIALPYTEGFEDPATTSDLLAESDGGAGTLVRSTTTPYLGSYQFRADGYWAGGHSKRWDSFKFPAGTTQVAIQFTARANGLADSWSGGGGPQSAPVTVNLWNETDQVNVSGSFVTFNAGELSATSASGPWMQRGGTAFTVDPNKTYRWRVNINAWSGQNLVDIDNVTFYVPGTPAYASTVYGNQRKIDVCQNGNRVMAYYDINSNSRFRVSTDQGVTWTDVPDMATPGMTYPGLFIDLDDYLHVVWKHTGTGGGLTNGYLYYMRGTPNAARTSWSWGAPNLVHNLTDGHTPDLVAHREGTGWRVHVVNSQANGGPNNYCTYTPFTITSAGVITRGTRVDIGGTYGVSTHTFPSIDFNHTGDGKTVAGGTPHLYAAWSAAAQGAGKGIRYRMAVYSGGSWTWNAEREIDNSLQVVNSSAWLNCMFDGTQVVLASRLYDSVGAGSYLKVWTRDVADTTTTNAPTVNVTAADVFLAYGSSSYDALGNVYIIGCRTQSDFALYLRKWVRATNTWDPPVLLDDQNNDQPYVSMKRGSSSNKIEWVYASGNNTPYGVKYDRLVTFQTYIRTAADSISTSDSVDGVNRTLHRTGSDSISTSDTSTRVLTALRYPYDRVGVQPPASQSLVRALVHPVFLEPPTSPSDTATGQIVLRTRTATDSTSTTDAASQTRLVKRTASDSAPASDGATQTIKRTQTASDSVAGLSDAAVRVAVPFKRGPPADSASATDGVTRTTVLRRSATDVATATESAVRAPLSTSRTASDSAPATDGATRASLLQRTGADVISTADALTEVQISKRSATDAAPASDVAVRAPLATTRTVTDAAPVSDAAARLGTFGRTLADTAPAADTASRVQVGTRSAADGAPVGDGVQSWSLHPRTSGDAAPATDDGTRLDTFFRSGTDTLVTTDAAVRSTIYRRTAADTAPAADTASRSGTFARALAESLSAVTDSATRTAALLRTADDVINTADVATRSVTESRTAADAASVSEVLTETQISKRTASDATTTSDTATRLAVPFRRTSTDTAPVSDGVTRVGTLFKRTAIDSISTTDGASRTLAQTRTATDSTAVSDLVARSIQTQRSAADATSTDDGAARTMLSSRTAADSIPATDFAGHLLTLVRTSADDAPAEDSVVAETGVHEFLSDDAPATDGATRVVGARRTTTDGLPTPTDALATTLVRSGTATDSTNTTDAASRTLLLQRLAADSVLVTDVASQQRLVKRTGTDSAPAEDAASRAVTTLRTGADTTDTTDLAIRQAALRRTTSDAAPATDDGTRQDTFFRAAADTLVTADTATRQAVYRRSAIDSAPASDSATRMASRSRTALDGSTTGDAASRLTSQVRTATDSNATVDVAVRMVAKFRTSIDVTTTTDALLDVRLLYRGGIEALTTSDLVGTHFSGARVLFEVLPEVTEWLDSQVILWTLPGGPLVTIDSVSTHRVSRQDGCDQVIVAFSFDRPVVAWEVRINSTGPFDGNRAASWSGGPVESAVVLLDADGLRNGENALHVYGQSIAGLWSAHPV